MPLSGTKIARYIPVQGENMFIAGKSQKGFTLVEVLIAAGVLSMFIGGVFAFYRMGSTMFQAGSWRLQKQKEAERFLNILKERIEQASNATYIDPAGDPPITEAKAKFLALNDGVQVSFSASESDGERLMLFSVCKPDLSKLGAAVGPGTGPGLVMYHCLWAQPGDKIVDAKKLYTLYLHANTSDAAHGGIDYFNTSETFKPAVSTWTVNASPADFSLQSAPFTAKLTDVVLASFSLEIASGTNYASEMEKVIGISIKMQHPRYPATTVTQAIKAKIDYSVEVDAKARGGF